jgi:hypothetical protein
MALLVEGVVGGVARYLHLNGSIGPFFVDCDANSVTMIHDLCTIS